MAELGLAHDDLVEIPPDVKRGVVSLALSWGGTSLTDEKVRDIGAPTTG